MVVQYGHPCQKRSFRQFIQKDLEGGSNFISALVGNSLALVYRLKFDTKRLKIAYGIFVTNLTIADFLMGVYLIIIAIADQMYRNR